MTDASIDVARVGPSPRAIDANCVAQLYGCSLRSVFRLAEQGQIPLGFKLGALRRWNEAEILAHIAAGAKPLRPPERAAS